MVVFMGGGPGRCPVDPQRRGRSSALQAGEGRQGGKWFRAFDKKTGAIVWEMELPAGTSGAPMTYLHNGKQYIVIAVGGNINGKNQAQFMAYRLPGNNTATKGRGAPPPDEQ